jgi:hypothetical protein
MRFHSNEVAIVIAIVHGFVLAMVGIAGGCLYCWPSIEEPTVAANVGPFLLASLANSGQAIVRYVVYTFAILQSRTIAVDAKQIDRAIAGYVVYTFEILQSRTIAVDAKQIDRAIAGYVVYTFEILPSRAIAVDAKQIDRAIVRYVDLQTIVVVAGSIVHYADPTMVDLHERTIVRSAVPATMGLSG